LPKERPTLAEAVKPCGRLTSALTAKYQALSSMPMKFSSGL